MKPRRSRNVRGRNTRAEDTAKNLSLWVPRTELGKKVHSGEISSMHEVIKLSTPIKEIEIVDKLLQGLSEEIIDVGRVQRVTDSGRRMRFRVVMAVGNNNGYVGVGEAKGREAGPTIRKAIEKAKMNIKEIKRGCGSWECGCGNPHSVPFQVKGKAGSVEVKLYPAPKGTGLVSGEIARKILTLAGINDAWVHTRGHTRSSINFAHAISDALVNTNRMKVKEADIKGLGITSGLKAIEEDEKQGDEESKE
ncbi:MAG: 30S ribosomal protein S5 [Candidatus Altiarchaeota archaeon]|nr:30S ribosomal protein S5 [Candidatus Altiarchaeota archaeon]